MGLEYISDLLTRYRVQELNYLSNTISTLHKARSQLNYNDDIILQFEKHTIALYANVVEYQIRMVFQYDRGGMGQYFRNLVLADDWNAILQKIKQHEDEARKDTEVIDQARLKSIMDRQQTIEEEGTRRGILSALSSNYRSTKDSYPTAIAGKWLAMLRAQLNYPSRYLRLVSTH